RLYPEFRIVLAIGDRARMLENAGAAERRQHRVVESQCPLEIIRPDGDMGQDAGIVVGHGLNPCWRGSGAHLPNRSVAAQATGCTYKAAWDAVIHTDFVMARFSRAIHVFLRCQRKGVDGRKSCERVQGTTSGHDE